MAENLFASPKSTLTFDANEARGKTCGSEATLHHVEDDELVMFDELSVGRGPLGNENEAIAIPPPSTTETVGSIAFAEVLAVLTETMISCST